MSDTDKAKQRQLIDAINLLAEHAEANMADGFEIVLHFSKSEAYMDLTDPEGNDIDYGTADNGWSSFDLACQTTLEAGDIL